MPTLTSDSLPVDYTEVRGLLSSMNEDPQRQWTARANLWIQAFSRFKEIRLIIGLPENQEELNAYRAALESVEQHGQLLLMEAEQCERGWSGIKIGEANFRAAVAEMEADDQAARSGALLVPNTELDRLFA